MTENVAVYLFYLIFIFILGHDQWHLLFFQLKTFNIVNVYHEHIQAD